MKKSARTGAGAQRWRCTDCNLTTTAPRPASPPRIEHTVLGEPIAWATSSRCQAEAAGGSGRAFRRRTAWCWHLPIPRPPVTGEMHPQVFIDGMWPGSWVLLVARSPTHVIAWQWAASESTAAYTALLAPTTPPDLATTDGADGALKALRSQWPDTPVQRCLERLARKGQLFAYPTNPDGLPHPNSPGAHHQPHRGHQHPGPRPPAPPPRRQRRPPSRHRRVDPAHLHPQPLHTSTDPHRLERPRPPQTHPHTQTQNQQAHHQPPRRTGHHPRKRPLDPQRLGQTHPLTPRHAT